MEIASTFLELIREYGLWGGTSAVVLYGALRHMTKLDKILSFMAKKDTSSSVFRSSVKVSMFIQDLLEKTLKKVGASRTCVLLYHNGQHSVNGHGFSKMSCIHEVIDSEVNYYGKTLKPIQHRLKSIPISAFSTITKRLFTEGMFCIKNISTLKKTDISTYEEFKYHGAQSAKFYPLIDSTNHIFGFVCFEFREQRPKTLDPARLKEEEECVDKITSVLELDVTNVDTST